MTIIEVTREKVKNESTGVLGQRFKSLSSTTAQLDPLIMFNSFLQQKLHLRGLHKCLL